LPFISTVSRKFAFGRSRAYYKSLQLEHTLDNPNAYGSTSGDEFGENVAVSGNYAIVGVPNEGGPSRTFVGKAYIFNVTSGALVHTLDNPNAFGDTTQNDQFGFSVAISGNRAIVSAVYENDAGGANSGKAYIFDVTSGSLLHTLDNPNAYDTSAGDSFGFSVAISDDRVIVGAPSEGDAGGTFSGKAYIFNVTDGSLLYTLDNPNAYATSASDSFGQSVAISGDRAIVSAYIEDDANGIFSGKAYIFDVTSGSLLYTLDNPNAYGTSTNDNFGNSVAISGDRAIVGTELEDDAGGSDSGKAYIFDVTDGSLVHTLDNPNAYDTSAGDRFGVSVAISGDRAIVGARLEDDAGGTTSGKAYIFDVTSGSLLQTLDNPNTYGTTQNDQFGIGVAISGDRVIVGAHTEGDVNSAGSQSGVAYIYKLSDSIQYQPQNLYALYNPNAFGTSADEYFGWSVAISGDYAIVGAPFEDDAGGTGSGKAYIFDITSGSLLYTLDNPNTTGTSTDDRFGELVAISGNRAIVGAYFEDDAGGFTSGKAYIFDVTSGSLVHILNNPNAYGTSGGDAFGVSVAISGNRAIVGAYFEDDAGGSSSGKAYIYDVTSGALVHTLDNSNAYGTSTNDLFGLSVAISGDRAIVGAYGEDDAGGTDSGKAYIYDVTSGALVHTLDNPNDYLASNGDRFGNSVAISGDRAIVGAPQEDDAGGTSSGKAYIYDVTSGALVHTLDNPNAYDTSAGDRFGESVAVSGNYAIVGAWAEDDAGGFTSSKAYIFNVTTGSLLYTLNNPNVYDTSDGDAFGRSVAISGDRAIVGARFEDDAGGGNSGAAYVFELP